jgi:hypothetical protein
MAKRERVVTVDIVPMGDVHSGSWDEYELIWPNGESRAIGDGEPAYWVLSNLLEFVAGERSATEFRADLLMLANQIRTEG